jgi:hypothetical protein
MKVDRKIASITGSAVVLVGLGIAGGISLASGSTPAPVTVVRQVGVQVTPTDSGSATDSAPAPVGSSTTVNTPASSPASTNVPPVVAQAPAASPARTGTPKARSTGGTTLDQQPYPDNALPGGLAPVGTGSAPPPPAGGPPLHAPTTP